MKIYKVSEQILIRMEDDLKEIQTKLNRSIDLALKSDTADEAFKNGALNPVQYAYESGRAAVFEKLINVIKVSNLRKKN